MQLRQLSYGKLKSWYCNIVKKPPPIPPYSHIVQIGDPILRQVSERVPTNFIKSPEMQFLLKQMKSVFKKYDCVGLSAPQIGIALQVIIVEFNKDHAMQYTNKEITVKSMDFISQTVVINPELKIVDYKKVIYSEACESILGFSADVARYNEIEVHGLNENAEQIVVKAKGWLSRILQHELDHLNGKLYTDLMDRRTLSSCCWQAVNERRGKVELPFSR